MQDTYIAEGLNIYPIAGNNHEYEIDIQGLRFFVTLGWEIDYYADLYYNGEKIGSINRFGPDWQAVINDRHVICHTMLNAVFTVAWYWLLDKAN